MLDIQEQLALLRRRVARVDRKFARQASSPPLPQPRFDPNPSRYFVEHYLSGEQVETPFGCHFETERLYESSRRHGSLDISSLNELPDDLLEAISDGAIPKSPCARWAFLDTETTGLAGGCGTYAFLIGVGRITPEGFRLRQFFMRDLGEESSLLHALGAHLAEFDVLVTYNGKVYDQPLLETRYRMACSKPPFSRLEHLDLLFGARRLWKLRFDRCRLVDLENQVLGVEREGDLPGEMIPYVYFEYLRTKEAFRVVPILHHNAMDIVTLACLTAIVPWAYRSPEDAPFHHGAELVGLARWLHRAERFETALQLFRRALDRDLADDLLFRTMWDVAVLEKKLGRDAAALAVLTELAACRNAHRLTALEELAKHYEHRERNYAMALEFTLAALQLADTDRLRRRRVRLEHRLAGKKQGRALLAFGPAAPT
ncbi:MAG: ribonuclease H-like domain-containing protein [Bryobacteraceae bacterium]